MYSLSDYIFKNLKKIIILVMYQFIFKKDSSWLLVSGYDILLNHSIYIPDSYNYYIILTADNINLPIKLFTWIISINLFMYYRCTHYETNYIDFVEVD